MTPSAASIALRAAIIVSRRSTRADAAASAVDAAWWSAAAPAATLAVASEMPADATPAAEHDASTCWFTMSTCEEGNGGLDLFFGKCGIEMGGSTRVSASHSTVPT